MPIFSRSKSGFTLIELMITVSIIATLTMIGIISFQGVQKNARDTRRKSDLVIVQGALEQYHADQGYYPASLSFGTGSLSFTDSGGNTKTYQATLPRDPVTSNYSQYYYLPLKANLISGCDNNGTNLCLHYCLYAQVENSSNIVSTSCQPIINLDGGFYNYEVQSQ